MPPIMGDLHRVFESRRGGLTGTAGVLARPLMQTASGWERAEDVRARRGCENIGIACFVDR